MANIKDDMTLDESVKTITDIVSKIEQTDSNVLKTTNNLRMVLLNLQIENARIKGNTAIQPIIDSLERSIKQINKHMNDLISENRDNMTKALTVLNEHINK
jgi:CHASE3 domain sensor protein